MDLKKIAKKVMLRIQRTEESIRSLIYTRTQFLAAHPFFENAILLQILILNQTFKLTDYVRRINYCRARAHQTFGVKR